MISILTKIIVIMIFPIIEQPYLGGQGFMECEGQVGFVPTEQQVRGGVISSLGLYLTLHTRRANTQPTQLFKVSSRRRPAGIYRFATLTFLHWPYLPTHCASLYKAFPPEPCVCLRAFEPNRSLHILGPKAT